MEINVERAYMMVSEVGREVFELRFNDECITRSKRN